MDGYRTSGLEAFLGASLAGLLLSIPFWIVLLAVVLS